MGFMILTMVAATGWAHRVGFGGPSGPVLPRIANSRVQYSKDVGMSWCLKTNRKASSSNYWKQTNTLSLSNV